MYAVVVTSLFGHSAYCTTGLQCTFGITTHISAADNFDYSISYL